MSPTHQPVPSSEADGFLHDARQADERALRAIVARHANLMSGRRGRYGGGQRWSAGLRSGVGRQSSKDVCVFLAPTRKLRQLGLEDASTFVLRGCAGWAGRTRARALGSSPEPIEYRASIECRYFGDVRAGSGRGKSDGVAPTPASFRRGRTKKAVWREYTLSALRVLGRTWVCLRSRGSPSSSKSSPLPFSFHSDAIEHGPDARDDSRGRLPPRGTDRRKLESSFQTKDAKQWPKKN